MDEVTIRGSAKQTMIVVDRGCCLFIIIIIKQRRGRSGFFAGIRCHEWFAGDGGKPRCHFGKNLDTPYDRYYVLSFFFLFRCSVPDVTDRAVKSVGITRFFALGSAGVTNDYLAWRERDVCTSPWSRIRGNSHQIAAARNHPSSENRSDRRKRPGNVLALSLFPALTHSHTHTPSESIVERERERPAKAPRERTVTRTSVRAAYCSYRAHLQNQSSRHRRKRPGEYIRVFQCDVSYQ